MGLFVRKVKTAAGAVAVQIAEKRRGVRTIVEHLGSAHTEAEVAVLVQVAKDKIAGDQQEFDLQMVYHYSFTREKRDNYTLNKQIAKAEKIVNGREERTGGRFGLGRECERLG